MNCVCMLKLDETPLRYTLCFLTRGETVLMLQRNAPPNQGLWNGVGGRIEPGETPLASCLREVAEETGFRLPAARFAGILTWEGFEIPAGGLYLFTAPAPAGEAVECAEGRLEWKPREWVYTSPDVVSNIPIFLPEILAGAPPQVYHFVYDDGKLVSQHRFAIEPALMPVFRV